MLDCFEILTTSGVVLWSRSFSHVKGNIINGFIRDVFVEGNALPANAATGAGDTTAANNPSYRREKYTVKWTSAKDLGLIFVAVYQSLLHLSWIDKLLDNIRIVFADLYRDQLQKPHTSIVECGDFDRYFDQQLQELEGTESTSVQTAPQIHAQDTSAPGTTEKTIKPDVPSVSEQKPAPQALTNTLSTESSPNVSRPATPSNGVISGNNLPKGASRRARKAAAAALHPASSGDERKLKNAKKDASKKMRRWDADGMADEDDGAVLDYSAQAPDTSDTGNGAIPPAEDVNTEAVGTRTAKGQFVLKDLDQEVHSILQNAENKKAQEQQSSSQGIVGSSMNAISGLFRNVVGGKVLTKADLEKPLKDMEEHLLKKNVAREAAVRLCEGVEQQLVGIKTGSFESIDAAIRTALTASLRHLLTPTTSLDILRSISDVTHPTTSTSTPRPYVISIVGVNGVGKSTSLAKLAFFLLQNKHSLLIAACDTFRSGAVEQLRVHARNLSELSTRESLGKVELYERGYGKDAAHIAKDAISYAATQGYDVVLIDTAGRRHNDTRLMSSLEKFAQLARPDKILMVGEALVGTDSVAQARSFNAAFGQQRRLDGFLISKCDTVGDMVGSLVSMVHATGVPITFLGVGQHYGDLRTLNVDWAVRMLMA